MKSILFNYAVKRLKPLMLLVSVIILLRGHNEPGGGFIGGLIAASAYLMFAISEGPFIVRKKLWFHPIKIMGVGLLFAIMSLLPSWLAGNEFMKGIWMEVPFIFGHSVKLGTPLIFDIGVYFVVIGFTLNVFFVLMEEWRWK